MKRPVSSMMPTRSASPSVQMHRSWLPTFMTAIVESMLGGIGSTIAVMKVGNQEDRKSTRLNSSHVSISYAVFCLKKKKKIKIRCVRNHAHNAGVVRRHLEPEVPDSVSHRELVARIRRDAPDQRHHQPYVRDELHT